MKVLTFSRHFPKGHPKAGQPTWFVEQVLNVILPRPLSIGLSEFPAAARDYINDFFVIDGQLKKHHTIRAGNRWKVGDMASLRVWSDKPYRSKQIEFAQVEVKKVWDFVLRPIKENGEINTYGFINEDLVTEQLAKEIANNDGLLVEDFDSWFCPDGTKFILSLPIFTGQIICWSDKIDYTGKPDLNNQ